MRLPPATDARVVSLPPFPPPLKLSRPWHSACGSDFALRPFFGSCNCVRDMLPFVHLFRLRELALAYHYSIFTRILCEIIAAWLRKPINLFLHSSPSTLPFCPPSLVAHIKHNLNSAHSICMLTSRFNFQQRPVGGELPSSVALCVCVCVPD